MRKILAKTVKLFEKNKEGKKIKKFTQKVNERKFFQDGTVNDYEQGI